MFILTQILISIALSIIAAALAPKPPDAEVQEADIPKSEEGAPIPVVFGTVRIKSSNTVWWGDPRTERVRTKSGK